MQEVIQSFLEIAKRNAPIYSEGGAVFDRPWRINPPADDEKIKQFEAQGFRLPPELKMLLKATDGIQCVTVEQSIYGVDSLLTMAGVNKGELRPGVYGFGYFLEDWLYIDSSRIDSGDYIICSECEGREGFLFGYGFKTFFDRLAAANFHPFWGWNHRSAEGVPFRMEY